MKKKERQIDRQKKEEVLRIKNEREKKMKEEELRIKKERRKKDRQKQKKLLFRFSNEIPYLLDNPK